MALDGVMSTVLSTEKETREGEIDHSDISLVHLE